MDKQKTKQKSDRQLMEALADDLVKMHEMEAIDLADWSSALEIVRIFYPARVTKHVSFGTKYPIVPKPEHEPTTKGPWTYEDERHFKRNHYPPSGC